jgi:hypothetical protein
VDIRGEAALVPAVRREDPGGCPGEVPGLVPTVWRLDLDDVRTEVGENDAARRAHDDVGELDDANAGERKLAGLNLAHAAAVPGTNPFGSPASAIWP